jgi:hypothetical protein
MIDPGVDTCGEVCGDGQLIVSIGEQLSELVDDESPKIHKNPNFLLNSCMFDILDETAL